MSTIQDPRKTWLATGSLLTVWWRMPSLGPRLPLGFQLWLSPTCLSASSCGRGPVCSWLVLLWYSLNPLFCEWAGLRLRLELFARKFSLFFLSLAVPQFGLLSQVSSLRLSSGHSGLVLTLSLQPAHPYLAPLAGGGHKCLGYFSTGSCS